MTRFPAKYDDLAAGPPPEVLAQVDVAWERAREMFDSDMDLHFEVDAELGEVWAELRFADGSLAERLTATEAMDLACGDAELRLAVAA
jgi:hypothetical protein